MTLFNESENFTFKFSFKNKLQDEIIVTPEFITHDFFRVFSTSDNYDMGKPWTGVWCEFIGGPREFGLMPKEVRSITSPWVLTTGAQPDHPLCSAYSPEFLPKGTWPRKQVYYFDQRQIL